MCAFSQIESSILQAEVKDRRQQTEVNEEELQAMTALLQDDEDFEDFAPPKTPAPETERLNQVMTVFAKKKTPEPEPSSTKVSEVDELAKARRLQQKAQGEASWVRKEMEKNQREFIKERKKYKDEEFDLREKLKDEKKKTADIEKRFESRNFFLLEEQRELKEKVDKLEAVIKKEKKAEISPRGEDQEVTETEAEIERGPVTAPRSEKSSEPATASVKLVLERGNKTGLAVRKFCAIYCAAPAELKCSLLQASTETEVQAVLSWRDT